MSDFRLLTNQTSMHNLEISFFIPGHQNNFLQIMIHFSSTRMNTQPTTMSFFQNTLSNLGNIRNTHPITKSHNAILVNSGFTSLTLVNQCQPIHQTNIRFLSISNFFQNTTSQLQHTQSHTIRSSFTYQTQVSELFDQFQFTNHQH